MAVITISFPATRDDTRQPWLEASYYLFAQAGPQALKVKVLAWQVGFSKFSFYHHFADLPGFTEALLTTARQV